MTGSRVKLRTAFVSALVEVETKAADELGARAVADPRYSPNDMERDAEALLANLIPLRNATTDKAARKQLSARIQTARLMRDWARTRVGYHA